MTVRPYDLNNDGEMSIGGIASTQLAQQFGTPLYVYDVAKIRAAMRGFLKTFEDRGVEHVVSYASKAFSSIAMYEVAAQEGIHLDLVSGGEIYTALKANFPMENVSFNGNNKSEAELILAIENDLGTIIVDNFYELSMLTDLLAERQMHQNILLRITPGVEAHTHEYITTGQTDSKFGFDVNSGQAQQALEQALASEWLNVLGVHAHIGSQIFEVDGFVAAADRLMDLVHEWGFEPQVVNLGGGFGIRYTDEDAPLPTADYLNSLIDAVQVKADKYGLPMPAIWIEPGRSIVGPAGTSLYTVGSRKDVPGIRSYLSVDGGMGDNIRPALYDAKYKAVLANQPEAPSEEVVRVAGKYCESGDVLVWQESLPKTKAGDILAVLATGAYGYSMASNYNRNPRPAVIFVENGQAKVAIERESYDDLVHLDRHLG
jgi:diaminopimelate decarboxylase